MAYVAQVGAAAGPTASATDLLVSSKDSGALASAHISSTAPPATAASRPAGPVADAGVAGVEAGPDGDWHIRFGEVSFRWPERTVLLVEHDDHPGQQLPFFLGHTVGSNELVALYAGFAAEPSCDEFIMRGQTILNRNDTPASRELSLTYDHAGQTWHQTFFWAQTRAGPVVVKVQRLASSSNDLVEVAREVQASLRTR